MTPKEKSELLVKDYYDQLSPYIDDPARSLRKSKKCAIICVEQIIEAFKAGINNPECITIHIVHYWQDVLEILKAS